MYPITFPPFWIIYGYCFDVPGVLFFSRMKSAGFVSGLGASFWLFRFSTVTPVTINFLIHTQKFFVIVFPPYICGCLLPRLDCLIFFFIFVILLFVWFSPGFISPSVCRFSSSSEDVAIG